MVLFMLKSMLGKLQRRLDQVIMSKTTSRMSIKIQLVSTLAPLLNNKGDMHKRSTTIIIRTTKVMSSFKQALKASQCTSTLSQFYTQTWSRSIHSEKLSE